MISKISLALIIIMLSGCDRGINGQIEKCVQSGLKATEPYSATYTKSTAEAHWRIACLKASAGQ